MPYLNDQHAFGLPPGTVRAGAFLSILLATFVLCMGGELDAKVFELALTTTIGFYFGQSKTKQTN